MLAAVVIFSTGGILGINAKADAALEKAVLKSSRQYCAIPAPVGYSSYFVPDDTYVETPDGGEIAAVEVENDANSDDRSCYAVKYNSDGSKDWQRKFPSDIDALAKASDGQYLAYTDEDIYKFSSGGCVDHSIDGGSLGISDGSISAFAPDSDGGAYFIYSQRGTEGSIFSYSGVEKVAKMDKDGNVSVIYKKPSLDGSYDSLSYADGKLYIICANPDESFTVSALSTSGKALWSRQMPKSPDDSVTYFYSNLYASADGSYFICKDAEGDQSSTQMIQKLDGDFNDVWTTNLNDTYMDYSLGSDGLLNICTNTDSNWDVVNVKDYDLESAPSANPDNAPVKTVSAETSGDAAKVKISAEDFAFLNPTDIVAVNLGGTVVSLPTEVLQTNSVFSDLTLTQAKPSDDTQKKIGRLTTSGGTVVQSFDLDLHNSGVIHELGSEIKVTLHLTDAQIAAVTDPSNVKIYYFNPDTNSFTDMHGTVDIASRTAVFYTNHLSTYLIEQLPKASSPSSSAGSSSAAGTASVSKSGSSSVPNPETGGKSLIPVTVLMAVIAASLGFSIVIYRKKAC